MLAAGMLAAFCLFPLIIGSAPHCEDAAFPTDKSIRNLLHKEISGKMSSSPSYDCDLEDKAQTKFYLLGDDDDGAMSMKTVDTTMSTSNEDFVKESVNKWAERLGAITATKFGCTFVETDHDGKVEKRTLGCLFA
ncbi:hypothetical protein ANCCAN_19203 [Ancylostoma caninum]|uniref:SCP domain-containing protein n=1 Tax=Ancylostoma caninum TaxID=29170 RepID=A0A368FW20_ANCCA|nr:hypothetical protein ANCCAN_19203 [Ancylostoma caninum]